MISMECNHHQKKKRGVIMAIKTIFYITVRIDIETKLCLTKKTRSNGYFS